ncbi:hypothetical protein SAMN05216404_11076 [Nitrosospira multiformis]|uniref:DUF1963 domain-containing protein n=1 Tax=Nitrosospira multiformis TaxID=1231 RepID=A0A1H8LE56_9PROT|nr:hypothetical protein [Nitrosospira multiformis]SEO03470.1 hypothetical protein SAMN05216404_11076 [Nitrosospira multiformis]
MTEVDDLLADEALTMPQREERLAAAWIRYADRGAGRALDILSSVASPEAAALSAGYLSLLPGLQAEKQRVVESLAPRQGEWAHAVVDLIKALPPPAANLLLLKTLQAPDDPSASSVLFEIATYFPTLLHPFVEVIDDPLINQALLPGGPDAWAHDFSKQFRDSEDPIFLQALVRMRTDAARRELENFRAQAPSRMWPALNASIENCGIFRDTGTSSYFPKVSLGFVVDRGESPHRVGGRYTGRVPFCEFCFIPTGHALTLAGDALGWGLTRDPNFFWFQCHHHDHDDEPLFVHITAQGAERLLIIEVGEPEGGELPFVPGERALALEDHPNQIGIGPDRVPARGLHDVGGPPNWCRIDAFPRCPVCDRGMRYLAALDGGMTPFGRIHIPGTLFMFWCDPCSVSATRLQR